MRMKAKLLNTIVRAGGNPVLPAKETVTLDALAPVFPFCTGVRYPKHGNLWTEVNGERRIRKIVYRKRRTLFQHTLPGIA